MAYDPAAEYIVSVDFRGFQSGKEYIEAIIEDARKVLPANTEFSFLSWTDAQSKRRCGWAHNILTPREQQKTFNPLRGAIPKA